MREISGERTSRIRRVLIYSLVGFTTEVAFSAVHDLKRGRRVRFRTSPWMFAIYALIQPLYEPTHTFLRDRAPAMVRAAAYGGGFLAVEYASGASLQKLTGTAPWDYHEARLNVDGLIRLDYLFYWAAAGLALERLHDALTLDPDRSGLTRS